MSLNYKTKSQMVDTEGNISKMIVHLVSSKQSKKKTQWLKDEIRLGECCDFLKFADGVHCASCWHLCIFQIFYKQQEVK